MWKPFLAQSSILKKFRNKHGRYANAFKISADEEVRKIFEETLEGEKSGK